MTLPKLLVLTDRSQLRLGRGLVHTITECVDAGLTHVVVREHDLAPDTRAALVGALVGVPGLSVISSRVPDARADGLHLPSPSHPGCNALSMPAPAPPAGCKQSGTARYTREWGMLGRSCHTTEDVRRAAGSGADYVTLSPFAATRSKPGHGPALPKMAYAGHEVPVFALGGITTDNAAEALQAGAHGVAVMGDVMRSVDPARTVARLLEATR